MLSTYPRRSRYSHSCLGALNWATGETVAVKEITLANIPKGEISQIMVDSSSSNAVQTAHSHALPPVRDRSAQKPECVYLHQIRFTYRHCFSIRISSSIRDSSRHGNSCTSFWSVSYFTSRKPSLRFDFADSAKMGPYTPFANGLASSRRT